MKITFGTHGLQVVLVFDAALHTCLDIVEDFSDCAYGEYEVGRRRKELASCTLCNTITCFPVYPTFNLYGAV